MPIATFPAPTIGGTHTSNGIPYISDGVAWFPDQSGDDEISLPQWTTGTVYQVRALIVDPASPQDVYIALNSYVSDVSIAADVSNGNLAAVDT